MSLDVRSAIVIMEERYGADPEFRREAEKAYLDMSVAQALYDLRTAAGLTQRQLAERVNTTASAISRLEDADYEGHSLTMLRRIAEALGQRVVLRFEPLDAAGEAAANPSEESPVAA
ncbi:MAG: helix-turn-helix domain-containing protein [Armatimonadota bacterium]